MRVTSKNTGSDYLNVARKGGHHKGWFLEASPSVRQVSFTWSRNKVGGGGWPVPSPGFATALVAC